MENKKYRIYSLNFKNGKRYIGATKMKLEDRWNNGNNYKTCPHVNLAIKECGWENVAHEVLDIAFSKEEAIEKEKFYIKKYNTTNPDFGYNVLPGGDVSTNKATDEMKVKLGNGWRGKHRTDEEKKKIGEGVKKTFQRKESNGHYGMKHSEETKRKMSLSHGSKPVLQYTMDGKFVKRWEFVKDVENAGIARKTNVLACCYHYNGCKSSGGYKWEFAR